MVCEVLWKSQYEDKADPVDNPLKGIGIPNSKEIPTEIWLLQDWREELYA